MASIPAIVWKTYAPCSFRARAWAFGRTLLLEFDRILAHAPSRGHFVELGCGTGILTRALARRAVRVVGVDPAPRMVARARQNMEAVPATYVVAAVESLPLADAAFVVPCTPTI